MADREEVLQRGDRAAAVSEGAAVKARRRPGIVPSAEAVEGVVLRLASILALLLAWWILGLFFPPNLVPEPGETLAEVGTIITTGDFFVEIGNSLRRVAVGFGMAMAVSIPLGIVMGTFRRGESFFEPAVVLGLTMPGLVWALLMILIFGLDEISAYTAVAVTITPMLVINVWQGAKAVDKDLIDMATAFRASAWSKVVEVVLPQLTSHILGAIRFGLGLAWKVVVIVELFGFSSGVGYQIMRGFDLFSVKTVLSWAITFLVAMIFIEYGLVGSLERQLTRWRPKVDVWRR